MEDEKTFKEKNGYSPTTGCAIFFVLAAIIIFFVWKMIFGGFSTNTSGSKNGKPDEVELMSYAQTILDDNLSNPQYSSYKSEYTFIETGLRYKIEGYVTQNGIKEKFYIIIEFENKDYKNYKLVSLQVGNKHIY